MPATVDVSDTQARICLEGDVGIADAAEFKSQLMEALATAKTLCLSVEQCGELDVTILQLLYAAGQEASRRGVGFALSGPVPQALLASIGNAGMTAQFPDLHV